jgi:hypothetical protein
VAATVAATGATSGRRDRGMATFDEVRAMTWRLLDPKE